MRSLPLYPQGVPRLVVETEAPLSRTPHCTRCHLRHNVHAQRVCIGPRGSPGGVLILGPFPTITESASGEVFAAGVGEQVRKAVEGILANSADPSRPVAYDVAVRCAPKGLRLEPAEVDACRPHLAGSLQAGRYERIVALGPGPLAALWGGDAPSAWDARRGYAHLTSGAVVFILPDPYSAFGNRFAWADFVDCLRWALLCRPPPPPPVKGRALVVETAEDALAAVAVLRAAPSVTWDVETFGRQYDQCFRILRCGAAVTGASDAYVWEEAALNDPSTRDPLLDLLTDPDVEKVAMNGLYDTVSVHAAYGVMPQGVGRDVQYRRDLLDPEVLSRLEVQQALVGMWGAKHAARQAEGAALAALRKALERATSGQKVLFGGERELPPNTPLDHVAEAPKAYFHAYQDGESLTRYNALDVVSTGRLETRHAAALAQPHHVDLARGWDEVLHDATAAVAQLTAWGVRVNREAALALSAFLRMDAERYVRRCAHYGLTNLGNPDAVAEVLYDRLKLPVLGGTAGGKRSTASEVLEELEGKHPIVADIMEWRRLDKLRGTYADGLLKQVTDDGCVHVDFRITGARSGRMSAGGGLHGLPRASSPEGKMVRDILVPWPGEVLVELDVSQEELRVLAGLSGDEVMTEVFQQGGDLHQRAGELIAPQVWGTSTITSKQREVAKTINLSLVYGKGDAALGKTLGLSKVKAGEIKRAILGKFSRADAWMAEQLHFARVHGYARTFLDGVPITRRPLWGIAQQGEDETARKIRGHAERAARNTPVQGSSAHIIMRWIVQMVRWVVREKVRARIGLTVHDSLLASVHPDDLHRYVKKGKELIAAVRVGGVPLVADCKVGLAAGSLEKYKE